MWQIGSLAGTTLPIGITVLGVFILLLALLGGVSAWRESRAFLLIYFVFLLLFTLILFFVGIAVYVERNNMSGYITTGWNSAPPDLRQNLEILFGCCGWNFYNQTECCVSPSSYTQQWGSVNGSSYAYWACPNYYSPTQSACLPLFTNYLASYYVTAGGSAIGFAVFMFLIMGFVCYLMQGIKQKRSEQDLAKLRAATNTADETLEHHQIDGTRHSRGGGEGGETQTEEDQLDEQDDEEEEQEDED